MDNDFIINRLIYFVVGTMFFVIVLVITGRKYRLSEEKLLQKVSNTFAFKKIKIEN